MVSVLGRASVEARAEHGQPPAPAVREQTTPRPRRPKRPPLHWSGSCGAGAVPQRRGRRLDVEWRSCLCSASSSSYGIRSSEAACRSNRATALPISKERTRRAARSRSEITAGEMSCSGSIRKPIPPAEPRRVPGSGTSRTTTRRRTPPSSESASTTALPIPPSRKSTTSSSRCYPTPIGRSRSGTARPAVRRTTMRGGSPTSSAPTASSARRTEKWMRRPIQPSN
jgi:hypothetical protein